MSTSTSACENPRQTAHERRCVRSGFLALLAKGAALFCPVSLLRLRYFSSLPVTGSPYCTVLPIQQLSRLARSLLSRVRIRSCVPTVLMISGAGILTSSPSATSFDLTLGPDLPREDQLYPGILRYSAMMILTSFSLLIPAFSLPDAPLLLIGTASARQDCSSTTPLNEVLSFGVVFQPRKFSAQDLSTSELLRTL